MANQEQFEDIKQGVKHWNQWRNKHTDVEADLSEANLFGANLSGANLGKANLYDAILNDANLGKAILSEANLGKAYLKGANLSGANLSEANLYEADLSEADLSDADLGKAYFGKAYLRGANLFGANLRGAILSEANLGKANLSHADLSGANLYRVDLSGADLSEAILSEANLSGANLSGADLRGANLFGANLRFAALVDADLNDAILTRCSIYGIAVWNVKLKGATQDSLVITQEDEPIITVDNLKIAQFIYLLLNNQELRDVLNSVTERGVLLLGRFSDGGLEMLQSIAAELRKMKYLPMLFDFERPDNRNYTETVKTLVGLSRFVIVDLSGPSVPQELYATVPHFKIPFVPIMEEGRKPYDLFSDLLEYPWVLKPVVEFTSREQLMELLPSRIIEPAEKKFQERQTLLNQLFHR